MRRIATNLLIVFICIAGMRCITQENANPISIVPPGGGNIGISEASVRIVNNSSYTIYYLNVSRAADSTWGDDELGLTTIAPGESFTVEDITPGTYDLRVQTSGKEKKATRMGVTLTSGDTYTWTVTTSSFTSTSTLSAVRIVNNSSYTIYYLNISLATDSSWRDDQLGSSVISPGDTFTVESINPGTYDLRVQTSGKEQTATRMDVSLTAGQTYTWTVTTSSFSGSSDSMATLKVVNNSSYTIYYLYISSSSSSSWGEDQLGSSSISIGSTYTLYNIPPGTYDFKVASSGELYTATTFDVELTGGYTTTWTINSMSKRAVTSDILQKPILLLKKSDVLSGSKKKQLISSKRSVQFLNANGNEIADLKTKVPNH